MATYKKFDNPTYKKMLSLPFNSDLGYTDDEILDVFINSQTKAVTYWGLTKELVRDNLFPLLDKADLGHVLFLLITMAEGGGAGNWINHFSFDASPDPWECAQQDIDYILSCFTSIYGLCVSAPECIKPWEEDTPGEAQGVLASLSDTSIGAYYMVATFAGNAWVYASAWCDKNIGPAPLIYFGNPYDHLIDVLNDNVPDWQNSESGSSNPKPSNPNPEPENPSEKPPVISKPTESYPVLSRRYITSALNTHYQLESKIKFLDDPNGMIPLVTIDEDSSDNDNINEGDKEKPPTVPNPPAGGGNGSGNTSGSGTESTGEVWDYVQTLLGTNVGVGQNYGQCYGLAYNVVKAFSGFDLIGKSNAKDIWKDYPWGQGELANWESKECTDQNGSELKRGDIVCLESTGANDGYELSPEYGHVVILSKVANGQLEWIDQNYSGHLDVVSLRTVSDTQNFLYKITGYIRKVR